MKKEQIPTPKDYDEDIPSSMKGLFHESEEAAALYESLDLDQLNALLGNSDSDHPTFDSIDFPETEAIEGDDLLTDIDLDELFSEEGAQPQSEDDEEKLLEDSFRQLTEGDPGKKPKKAIKLPKFPGRKKSLLILAALLLALALLVGGGILLTAALDPYDNRILDNVTIGGVDVGGMTRREARDVLKSEAATPISQQPMVVSLPDGTLTLSPEKTKARLDVRAAVSEAFNLGRKGTEEEVQAALAASEGNGLNVDLLPHLKLEQEYIRSQLEGYAAQHNVAHSELSYRLTGSQPALEEDRYDSTAPAQVLELTLGTPREELPVEDILQQILNAYGCNTLSLTVESIAYLTTPAAPDLEALYQEFYIAPKNTTLDMETYRQIPGAYGYALDMDAAKELLSKAQYGDTLRIPMVCVKPEILGDEAYFRDELGYCETKHTNNENRNTNLTLACKALDGFILQPGEEFSYNGTVGERTKEKGYKPAPAYSGLNTVDSVGGGVCQVSSTLYYATLIADMEIVFRVNHGFRSSYIGIGLDATVNWGGPDFQFRNNSNFPVKIQAEVSDGFVKIRLMGTDEKDYYVKMSSGYSEDDNYYYSWSYKSKFDKETDELISREKEAYSCYMK